jgi:hypothetical protein
MRRPLFGNGFPRNVVLADGNVEVFNTENLDEGAVYALTLFMWMYQPGPAQPPLSNPGFGVGVETDGGAVVPVAFYHPAYLDSLYSTPNGPAPIEPIKVLDRYMLRGVQRVTMSNVNAASGACFVWGYFEQVGENDISIPFRGLQPSNTLVEPFAYPPAAISLSAPSTGASVVLHKLDPKYIDLVTIDVANAGSGDTSGNGFSSALIFPGGAPITMPSIDNFLVSPAVGAGLIRKRILDGIPMRALDGSDAGSNILLGGATDADGVALTVRGYGSFLRY